MTVFNKIKWVLGIVLVFLLVLTTNLVDRQNFRVMKDSIEAIYADRLVAQDIILDISKEVWEKEIGYASAGSPPPVDRITTGHAGIGQAIDRFAATTLTPQEEVVFDRLKASLRELKEREDALATGQVSRREVMESLETVKEELVELSAIQMKEGRRQLFAGKEAVGLADLFTQLEIGALLILAVCVQVIILYSPGFEKEPEARA